MQLRGELSLAAALRIFLGGAGVFMPLEMAFNRLWGFGADLAAEATRDRQQADRQQTVSADRQQRLTAVPPRA